MTNKHYRIRWFRYHNSFPHSLNVKQRLIQSQDNYVPEVGKETRSALPSHKAGDITSRYSAAEFQELMDAVGKIVKQDSRTDLAEGCIQAIKNPPTH